MAYTTIDNPTAYFNTKLIPSASEITSVGHQADMIWLKSRTNAYSHELIDTVRGIDKKLKVDDTSAESTTSTVITAIGSDSYTVGSGSNVVYSGSSGVGWSWKAGTSFTNDASSTGIAGIDSAGSFNNTAGFSIVTYTGNAGNTTVKHGMNVAPKMIFFKRRDADSTNWYTYHASVGQGKRVVLNTTAAEAADTEYMNNTAPTTSVFSLGPNGTVNTTGNHIAYCFAEIKGYSKFGSYTGNGNADGTFIYTGFKPAYFMVKLTSGANNWNIFDNKRNPFNDLDLKLYADTSGADVSAYGTLDFTSNGIKCRNSDGAFNGSGATYIYMAFAENPFVTSTGVPACAR